MTRRYAVEQLGVAFAFAGLGLVLAVGIAMKAIGDALADTARVLS